MEKLIKWIEKNRKKAVAIVLVMIFLPILLTHILFKIRSNCFWIEAEWSAGDLLGYFGSILSFVGTVVLGYIAITQSEKANQLNKKLLNIEKKRMQPYLDISSSQLYKIFMAHDMEVKLGAIDRNNSIVMEMLYNDEPRTGNVTNSVLIELDISNSGYTEIRNMCVKTKMFYLAVFDPFNCKNEKISYINGNSKLKVNESKKLYIIVKREISSNNELNSNWYIENIDKLMPHMEFEFTLETTTGDTYVENISCGSGWDISMESTENTTTRSIGILEVDVREKVN